MSKPEVTCWVFKRYYWIHRVGDAALLFSLLLGVWVQSKIVCNSWKSHPWCGLIHVRPKDAWIYQNTREGFVSGFYLVLWTFIFENNFAIRSLWGFPCWPLAGWGGSFQVLVRRSAPQSSEGKRMKAKCWQQSEIKSCGFTCLCFSV